MRRKQDQKHKQWRQQANNGAADNQGQRQEPDQQPDQTQGGGGVDPASQFEAGQQGDVNVGQSQNQQQQKQQTQQVQQPQSNGGQQFQVTGAQEQQGEPYEHDCGGHPGKAQFYKKLPNCPRCGKTLAWDKVGEK